MNGDIFPIKKILYKICLFIAAVGMTGESSLLYLKSSEDLHIYHLCICVCG